MVKISASIDMNTSNFVMMLHNSEIITQHLAKITKGEKNEDLKIHIGELVYLSCSSPYKVVQCRKWKKK